MNTQALNDLRLRVLAGETIPPAELIEAIKSLRGSRATASVQSTTSRKSKTKTPEEAQAELEGLLGGLGI